MKKPQHERRALRSRRGQLSWVVALLAVCVACLVVPWWISSYVRASALVRLSQKSASTLNLIVENLRGELSKFRSLPELIASTEELTGVLAKQPDPAEVARINRRLAEIARVSGALDVYVMNAQGLTVAASNYAAPRNFVGKNFGYRPYFQAAMKGRQGRYFALGTTSKERGYYFAYPIRIGRQIAGAVAVKLRVGHLEQSWRAQETEVAVIDRESIVFLTTVPAWRFRPFEPLTADSRAVLAREHRYTGWPFNKINLRYVGGAFGDGRLARVRRSPHDGVVRGEPGREFLVLSRDMPEANWTVKLFASTEAVNAQVTTAIIVALLGALSLSLTAFVLMQRRWRFLERLAFEERAKRDLETTVAARTLELTEANAKLVTEIDERRKAEEELRRTQGELIQASKMAAVGRLSAGLSHELNQPIAAIGTYASNAERFLQRDDTATVAKNLSRIVDLVSRMSRIVQNLKTFARREPVDLRPTSLASALEGAMQLLESRQRQIGAKLTIGPFDRALQVMAGDVRLQQVFVNLLSNALDEVTTSREREIRIDIRTSKASGVVIEISDTGQGIAENDLPRIFEPFFSTKAVGEGTGLGLSITQGLVEQFGGTIAAGNSEGGGARFTVTLKLAGVEPKVAA